MEDVEASAPEQVVQPLPLQRSMGDLAMDVFGNDLIRKHILDFAIHKANGKGILRGSVSSLRLVQKSWLKTIAKLFNKNGNPQFQIVLDANNSLNESPRVRQNGKILDQFVETVTSVNSSIHDSIPTFSLELRPTYFREENLNSLYNCLRLCGAQLVEIRMSVPSNGGSLPGIFPQILNLDRLKKIGVVFTGRELLNMENQEAVIAHESNATHIVQFFLQCAPALNEFKVPPISFRRLPPAPCGFQYLSFPETLTKINIQCEMSASQMELLANCQLPNLEELIILVFDASNDILFRIFNNFRQTLHFLNIGGPRPTNLAALQNMYRFPVMENLDCFQTYSINSGLEANQQALESSLPNLRMMSLQHQSVTTFRNWTENSIFLSVDTLYVYLANEMIPYENRANYIHNLDLTLMQRLHTTFPNITYLELTTSASVTSTCGFKYLFVEMKQLTSLAFIVDGTSSEVGSDLFWDGLLIGIDNLKLVAGLRESPESCEMVEIKNEGVPSIRMLKDLQCLKLLDKLAKPVSRDTTTLLISDTAFHYALLKMEKLKELHFEGRFLASEKMTEKWRECGNTLDYTPPLPPTN